AERVFGYTAHEVIGKPILILIPPERYNEEPGILARIRAGERVDHYETVRQRKDGTLIDISLSISPIHGPDGAIMGASKIARDVTELKRAQQQVRASDERYRSLFSSIDEGFCVIEVLFASDNRPVDWRFLEVNGAFEKHNGLVNAEGKTARELMPGLEDEWFEIYGKVALTGEAVRFEQHSEVLQRWFDLYAFPIGEPNERKVGVLFNNISQRKRSEQEQKRLLAQLEAERAKLAYLFSKAPALVATMRGSEHVLEMANPAYMQFIGHSDVVGKTVREAMPEIEGQGFFELLDRVFQTGEPFNGREMPIQLPREPDRALEERFVDFVYQPIFGPDGVVSGIFSHGVDITDQVQARKDAELANRAKDEFLATLSHELRTPLNAILGWSHLLGDNRLGEDERAQAVDTIQRNARLQAQLVEDILDVSRIISGKLHME
ncbi:MAG: PAS domain S-box protein, partial [Cytophagaceae bacterium]